MFLGNSLRLTEDGGRVNAEAWTIGGDISGTPQAVMLEIFTNNLWV
jgi:hypothetical protein